MFISPDRQNLLNHRIFLSKIHGIFEWLYLYSYYVILKKVINMRGVHMKFISNGTSLLPTSPGPV